MDDALTERYLIDRAEHDAHADGLAEQIEAEYADEVDDQPVPAGWSMTERDGVTVRLDGTERELIVLWHGNSSAVYGIRELCEALAQADGNAVYYGERDRVAAVYVREGDALHRSQLGVSSVPLDDRPGWTEVTVWVAAVGNVSGDGLPAAVGRYRVDPAAHPESLDVHPRYAEVADWLTVRAYRRGRADFAAGTMSETAMLDDATGVYYRRGLAACRADLIDAHLAAHLGVSATYGGWDTYAAG